MSKIVIIGAGAMGSAFALPCLDNSHDINIIGTHLEGPFISTAKPGVHPLDYFQIPNLDLIVVLVSSPVLAPVIRDNLILSIVE